MTEPVSVTLARADLLRSLEEVGLPSLTSPEGTDRAILALREAYKASR